MRDFLDTLVNAWWGIAIICFVCIVVWFILSIIFYRQFFKRFYDLLFSGIALIVFSPLLLCLIVFGSIKMKGNPFFTQLRPGKIDKKTGKERIFKMLKFRTMTCEKDEYGNLLSDEKRLTKYGKILRLTSLDELPELWNIFKGDMSIIGPRPLLIKDMVFMTEEQRQRHTVRGGLSGLAQVNGRNCISWEDKLNYDLQYIKKISIFEDIKLIFLTIFKVFKCSDINRQGTFSDIDYGDWLLQEGKIAKEEYAATLDKKL